MIISNIIAQSNTQVEQSIHEYSLKMIAGISTPLVYRRNYTVLQQSQGDVTSNAYSSLLALRFNYSKSFKFNSNFRWDLGIEVGADSYDLRLKAGQQFVDLGRTRAYYNELRGYDLVYSSAILSMRYNLPLSKKSTFTFKVGSRFTFFLPLSLEVEIWGASTVGISRGILFMEMESNKESTLIIAPDLAFEYYYSIPKSKLNISIGVNASFSSKPFLSGTYQIVGDQEILDGSVSKKARFLALNLGASYQIR